jgi:TonB-linked SusC/RagA family outer membrane protein
MTRLFRSTGFFWLALVAAVAGAPALAQGQAAVITGKVMSEQGQPLVGANVYINDLNISIGTNQNGAYTLTIPAARVSGQTVNIRVRAIGYQPQVRAIALTRGTQTVNFDVKKDVTQLGEVVVTGVTAATESIKLPFTVTKVDTTAMPVSGSNALSQLQGKVPGATIVSATGRPGAAPSVVLRGLVSLNATGRTQQPLYLLDGVPLQGTLPDINPNDIESVEVVKGASAASLYGARGGAGVINITTKTGRNSPQGIRFGVRTEGGTSDIERGFPIASRSALALSPTATLFCTTEVVGGSPCGRYIDWDQEVQRINNDGKDFSLSPQKFLQDYGISSAPPYESLTGLFQVTQWPHYRDPVNQVVSAQGYANTNLDMRAKVNNTGVYASVSNFLQQGAIAQLPGYTRNSVRVNVDQTFGNRISANLTSFYSQEVDHGSQLDEGGGGGLWFGITRAPWIADMLATDDLSHINVRHNPLAQGEQNSNPMYFIANDKRTDRGTRFVGGTTVRYTPLDFLNFEGSFGYDRATGVYTRERDRGWRTTADAPTTSAGIIRNGNADNESMTSSLSAALNHTFFNNMAATWTSKFGYSDQTLRTQDLGGDALVVAGLETADAATTNFFISSGSQSIRDLGFFTGVDFDFMDRYVLSGQVRRDGSSLFGAGHRWQTFGRVAGAWIVSREPWWPASNTLSLFKLRASRGSTGQRPRFSAQYETFTIGTGGTLNPATTGNKNLGPEVNTETELGTDIELFGRIGLNVSYAKAIIDHQILPVKAPTSSGFQQQWQNAGEITNKTWEGTLTVPIITRGSLNWTSRLIYDRTRSEISRLDVPEFIGTITAANSFDIFKFRQGEKIGTMYGFDYVKRCDQLPAPFNADCGGANSAYRANAQGYIVWVGAGNQLTEGVTKNLWRAQTGLGNGPWGNNTNWGMPITLRDSINNIAFVPIGNGLPKYHWGLSQSIDWKRLNLYGLLDASMGQKLWNIGYHWSLGDLQSAEVDQTGKSVEDAKPLGYYWRRGPSASPGGNAGVGGFYDALNPSSFSVEDASYVKLREASVNFRLGAIGGTGDWKVGVVGRNLHTWTDFRGWDPEAGNSTGPFNSSALTPVAGFRFPNLRTFTVQLSTSF